MTNAYFFRVLELPPEALVHPLCSFLGTADHSLDVDLEASVEKLIYLSIVIIIISEVIKKPVSIATRGSTHTILYIYNTYSKTRKSSMN